MYQQQADFRRIVAGLDDKKVERGTAKLKCPIIKLDGTRPVEELLEKVKEYL